MREDGLKLAIDAAGGIGALARGLGIKQPSVSAWLKVPAERVAAVETLTGVRRDELRPDLFASDRFAAGRSDGQVPVLDESVLDEPVVDEIELARAREYLLLAKLLRHAPSAELLAEVAAMRGNETALGMAHIELAEAAGRCSADQAAAEYFAIFIGIGRGEILPYASFYLTGFLHERPLARLRQDLGRLGVERAEGNFDPEDHLGLLFEVMGGFANGTFDADLATQKEFFEQHIAPWADRCLADIAITPSAKFYKAVALLALRFLEIEREAFQIED